MPGLRNRRLPYQRKKYTPPPEVIRKRAELAQGGDPVLASAPLGCCKARKLIRADDYFAGLKYAALYRRFTLKHIFPKAVSLDGDMQGPPPVDAIAEKRHETAYLEAKKILRGAGSRATQAVENIVAFEQWPAFIAKNMGRHDREAELEEIQNGLGALAEHFGTVTSSRDGRHRRRNDYERTGQTHIAGTPFLRDRATGCQRRSKNPPLKRPECLVVAGGHVPDGL